VIVEARAAAVALVEADRDLSRHPTLRAAIAEVLDADRTEFLDKA